MAFSIEAIIALVSIVVSLPPAVLIIWKIHQRYGQKKDNTREVERTLERGETTISTSNLTVVVMMRETDVRGSERLTQSQAEEALPETQM